MDFFLKVNKNIISYFLIILIVIPIFGIKFVLGFLSNILILLILIPLLIIVLVFLGFTYFKSKINRCNNCGAISLGLNNICMSCGSDLENIDKSNRIDEKPSESTIEVKAEEIK